MTAFRPLLTAAAVLCAPLALAAPGAQAKEATAGSGWVEADVARVRLLEGEAASPEKLRAALDIELKEGWKTYWRAPGETGVAPEFDWSRSTNLRSLEVLWPRPKKLDSGGAEFWGYDSHVALPISVTPEDPSKPVVLDLDVYLGVCKSICTPLDLTLSRRLTGEPATSDENRGIAEAEILVPHEGEAMGVALGEVRLEGEGIHRRIIAEFDKPGSFEEPEAIFASSSSLVFGTAETQEKDGKLIVSAPAMVFGKEDWVGEPISVTMFEGPFSAEAKGAVTVD